MQYCPHCMRPATGDYCPSCGSQTKWTAPPNQLPVGTLLRGSGSHVYQIGAAKGQGGFGITYAALDLVTNVRVAIKEYYPTRCAVRDHMNTVAPATGQLEAYQGGMHSFLEEAKTLSTVGALPSVVSIRDFFEANGTAYLVMEYVEGDALHQVVQKSGPMTEDALMPLLKELMRDLAILHRAGVIHRDISPDNLILTPQGTLKLLDFGAARSVQDGKSMTVMLKAGFSPVEQYQSKGQGPYTDVYALAGTIYYCLTGKVPPTAIDRITEDELVPPSKLGARIHQTREDALLWALTVQPSARPQNMDVFSNAMFPPVPGYITGGKGYDTNTGKPVTATGGKSVTATGTQSGRPMLFDPETGKPLTATGGKPVTATGGKPATATGTQSGRPMLFDPETGKPLTGTGIPASGKPKTGTGIPASGKPETGKKPRKGLIAVLCGTAALVAVAVLLVVLLTGGTTSDGYQYRLSGGDAHITGFTGSGAELTVPASVKDHKVVTIRAGAFESIRGITGITLPESVTTIEAGAFTDLPRLQVVTIQSKSVRVERGAFSGCGGLRCVVLSSEKAYDQLVDSNALRGLEDVGVCYLGQDFNGGKVVSVRVEEGIPYAVTDRGHAILLLNASDFSASELPTYVDNMRVFDTAGRRIGAVAGTTEDGFEYEILGGEGIIVGYAGSASVVCVPSDVEGKPVTRVASGALVDNSTMESLFLTYSVTTLDPGAVVNCPNLETVYVYSDITVPTGVFQECPKLRCVMANYCSVSGWTLPKGCVVVQGFADTGRGGLVIVDVDDQGVVYGLTDSDDVVVMSVPTGLTSVTIADSMMGYPVTWTHINALEGVASSTVIRMGSDMGFPFELLDRAAWEPGDVGAYAYSWLLTCEVCRRINDARPSGNPQIKPDPLVVEAATIRAKELSTSNSHTRPSGNRWSTVLNDVGAQWVSANSYKDTLSTANDSKFAADYEALINDLVEAYTDKNDDGKYYVTFGAALYAGSRSTAYCNAIAVIQ